VLLVSVRQSQRSFALKVGNSTDTGTWRVVNFQVVRLMSSISFPQSSQHSLASSSPSHHDQFYAPPFDSNSSFQMNPLSSHPPRTPRTSIISSGSQIYGTGTLESKEEEEGQNLELEKDLDDQEEEKVKSLQVRVRKEDVWREMFLTSNGRDKAFVRIV
jgi:hypothetical protein